MNCFTPHLLRPVLSGLVWLTLAGLSACGGGGGGSDPTPQPAAQSITFAAPVGQTFGVAPAALSATASSGLAVTLASTTPAVCTVSGTALTLVGVGSCTVVASQGGNSNFLAASTVTNTFAVAIGSQTLSFISPGNQTLGAVPAALSATASSGLGVAFQAVTPAVCTVSGATLTLVSAGPCTLAANQAGNANYAAAPAVSQTFTVAAAPLTTQTLTVANPANTTWGLVPPALTATASSGLVVSFASTTPSVCTVSGTTVTLVSAGTCSVTASQAGNTTFEAAPMVSRSFTVLQAAQAITFVTPGNQALGTATPALVATSNSGLAVTLASTTASVCTVSGTTLTLVSAGSCTITANQAGNLNVAAAASVAHTITVAPAPLVAQTITVTFTAPSNPTVGAAASTLSATASSGLPVSFASTTASVCTVNGTLLTLVAPGACTVLASQAGNATFAAAPTVSIALTVAPPLAVELMANGGFETAASVAGQFAQGWRGVNSRPATWSTDARTGSRSTSMAIPDPGFGGSGLVQNAVDDGGKTSILGLYVGKTTSVSFYAKGSASVTGNMNYSLRYLDAVGNILNTVVNTSFGNLINANTWTRITLTGPAIPANTSAIFLEMTLAVGPTGVQPPGNCGVNPITGVPNPCDNGQARVLIDDLSVSVVP